MHSTINRASCRFHDQKSCHHELSQHLSYRLDDAHMQPLLTFQFYLQISIISKISSLQLEIIVER